MLLSEHVYCVAIAFKMTKWVEQEVCIKFCIKLAHSSAETIWMIQKAAAMGNWWLAASSQQRACSCITSRVEFFGKTWNHPGDSAPPQPRFGTLWLLAFPKTKITFEREEISDRQWDSGKYDGTADGDWENCVRAQSAYFEGTEASLSYVQYFLCLLSCIFFNKCLYFSYYMAGYFLDRPHIHLFSAQSWRYDSKIRGTYKSVFLGCFVRGDHGSAPHQASGI